MSKIERNKGKADGISRVVKAAQKSVGRFMSQESESCVKGVASFEKVQNPELKGMPFPASDYSAPATDHTYPKVATRPHEHSLFHNKGGMVDSGVETGRHKKDA
jgi:hypothetical protein